MTVYIRTCFACGVAALQGVACFRCGGIDGVTKRIDDEDYEAFAGELAHRVVQDIESRLRAIVEGNVRTRDVVADAVVRHFLTMMVKNDRGQA